MSANEITFNGRRGSCPARDGRVAACALLTAAAFWILSAGCHRDGGSGLDSGAAEDQRGSTAAVPVAVEAAKVGGIAAHYSATATLEAEKQATVLARVSGIVKSIDVEEGDDVRADQTLLTIENDEYRYRLEQAEARTKNLQAKFERLKEISRDLISVDEFETSRNEYTTSRADEDLARLTLSYTTVTAPFDGRVVRRLADVGQNVSANTPLFGLADLHPLLARIHVPAKEFRRIQADQTVDLVLDSNGDLLQGRIKLVSPSIDPGTGTIKVTVEVEKYPPNTRPGDFVEARIVTEQKEASTLVPRLAVVTEKDEQVVYVASGEEVERRLVEVGFSNEIHAEIVSGVKPGEKVVVKGQRTLKHGARVKVIEDVATQTSAGPGGTGS